MALVQMVWDCRKLSAHDVLHDDRRWLLIYLFKMASGSFEGLDAAQIEGEFGELMGQPVLMTVCMAIVVVLCFGIVIWDFRKALKE